MKYETIDEFEMPRLYSQFRSLKIDNKSIVDYHGSYVNKIIDINSISMPPSAKPDYKFNGLKYMAKLL